MSLALTQNLNNIFFSEDDIHEKPYDELLAEVQTFITENHAKEVTAEGEEAEDDRRAEGVSRGVQELRRGRRAGEVHLRHRRLRLA